MPGSFTNLLYHIVFSTKNREPLIREDKKERLYDYMGGIVRLHGGIMLELNGMPDHVHLVAKLRPDEAVSVLLRDLKSSATGWMHKVFPDESDFGWQNGYAGFTVSQSQLQQVRNYVKKQEQHHGNISFREEFVQLLRKNCIEFDERYLWK
jgi:putative transposase